MFDFQEIISQFVVLWAVIDPVGNVPVFIATTTDKTAEQRKRIALIAAVAAAGILLFFILVGELLLSAMGVPLLAFQVAGGIVLFLFALTMIFGESKPESESKIVVEDHQIAIFPLATPSTASPGAMMAVVLLTKNDVHSFSDQAVTAIVMLTVVFCAFLLMYFADAISRLIGSAGASLVSRVMGLILAAIAATHVLEGLKEYFS